MKILYEQETKQTHLYKWVPGNDTIYNILITHDKKKLYLTWYRYSSSGVDMIIPKDGFIHHTYIEDKLRCSQGDSAPILALLKKCENINIGMPPGFNQQGIYTGTSILSD